MLAGYQTIVKNRNFLSIWISQISSQVAINIMNFILIISLFEKTNSTIATSFLWVDYALPAIIIGPIAAASVDMLDRKKILIITNLIQSALIFLYAMESFRNIFGAYVLVFVYSLINQFYVPAESATVPTVVKKIDYAHANGLFFLTQQASIIFGFGIAGILNRFLGFRISLLFCSGLLFVAFLSVLSLPKMKATEKIGRSFESAFTKFFQRMLGGYIYIKENRSILFPILILMFFQALLAVVVVNIPAIATTLIHVNVNLAGVLLIVPAGIGATIGTLSVPQLMKKGVRKKILMQNFLVLITLSMLSLYLISFLDLQKTRILLSAISIIFVGLSFIGIVIPCYTFLQEKTPGGYRGRVFGNFWFLTTIVTVFPVVFSGTITDFLGVRALLLIIVFVLVGTFLIIKKYAMTMFAITTLDKKDISE